MSSSLASMQLLRGSACNAQDFNSKKKKKKNNKKEKKEKQKNVRNNYFASCQLLNAMKKSMYRLRFGQKLFHNCEIPLRPGE